MTSNMGDAAIFAILTTGAVLIAIQIARLLRAWMQHRTIREAISRDRELAPELLAGFNQDDQPAAGANDDRTAFVLIAIGLALILFAIVQGNSENLRNLGGAAMFPTLVGGALLLRFHLARRRGTRP